MNDNKCSCECQITIKDYVRENGDWNNGICTCKNGKYSGSIVSDSVIRCDENIKVTKTIPTRTVAAKKGNLQNKKILYFNHLFINYHTTIDNR